MRPRRAARSTTSATAPGFITRQSRWRAAPRARGSSCGSACASRATNQREPRADEHRDRDRSSDAAAADAARSSITSSRTSRSSSCATQSCCKSSGICVCVGRRFITVPSGGLFTISRRPARRVRHPAQRETRPLVAHLRRRVFLAVCVWAFFFFYPVLAGEHVTWQAWSARMWIGTLDHLMREDRT